MMHGHEKSDPAIVAMKPANKVEQLAAEQSAAEPTAAEPVEPRVGTKEMRASKPCPGHRARPACHMRWSAYGKSQGKGRRRSSSRSPTTSASIFSRTRSTNSRWTRHREWTD